MPGTTDTVKAKLTPGEFVIRKEAVDMIGVPMLNKLNNMPEEGGHSAIDRIIDMATMSNMKMMYGGGMVKPNYAGGGMVQQYGHGGSVNKMMGYQKGGQLKAVPEGNPGLGKLPEMVRNRMGYMQEGGMVDDSLMGMMGGGMAKKKKMMGYQEGGDVMLPPQPMDPLQIGARQADPSMYEGSTLGAVRDQAMMLQDSIEQDTVNKARNSLKLMALIDSLRQAGAGESVDYMPMNPMPPTRADSMRVRDLMEFLNMQQMQRMSQ